MSGLFRISKRDLRLVLILLGAAAMFCLYWFGARDYMAKTEAVDTEIAELTAELEGLRERARLLETYQTAADMYADIVQTEAARYPKRVISEDWIRYAAKAEKRFGTNMPIIEWGESDAATVEFDAKTRPGEAAEHVTIWKANMRTSFSLGYADMKDFCDYVRDDAGMTAIDSASFAFDSGTGLLKCDVTLAKYAAGDGGDEPREPVKNGGVRNPFGTLK